MTLLAFLVTCVCSAWTLLGLVAVLRVRLGRAPLLTRERGPAVTVLKPLCGADAELEANLESFFVQDHPNIQLLFGVVRADDPAVAVVRTLMARHPDVQAHLVIHAGGLGVNPKVEPAGMLPAARRRPRARQRQQRARTVQHYVAEMVATLGYARDARPGHEPVLPAPARTARVGARERSAQRLLRGGRGATTLLGDALVVGKSMLFSQSVFERLGGFARRQATCSPRTT